MTSAPAISALWHTGLGPVALTAPLFLGIVNVTPDSMSDGGRFLEPAAAVAQGRLLARQGAAVLDLGAESTRPGAAPVGPDQEWSRLEPVLAVLRAELPQVPLSLDTRHPLTAARGLRAGAAILNDVTGFSDPELLGLAQSSACGLIAMRSRMTDGSLDMPAYGLPAPEEPAACIRQLVAVRDRLLRAGIAPERILLDPGFGFGTSYAGDQALWQALPGLPAALDWPVERFCIGISRKRFLAWRAGSPDLPAGQRDVLTAQAHREAMAMGYRVFRSHRVA
ncbi:MAG: dihydropteroate synthase [Holophaga sp.]|nr:dihydropteroate synthase [Holophaga sp.]